MSDERFSIHREVIRLRQLPVESPTKFGICLEKGIASYSNAGQSFLKIWETDFQLIANVNTWKENMRKSVESAIISNEKRLKELNVTVDLSEEEIRSPITQILSVKKRVLLRVKAKTVLTGEDFVFETKMFISPLSID